MGVDVYGGNPVVVASYNELVRIATALQLVAQNLDHARFAGVGAGFFAPVSQIQLAMLLPGLVERVRDLAIRTQFAADSYFSTESQVIGLVNSVLSPVSKLSSLLGQPIALFDGSTKLLANVGASFAAMGLTGKANLAKTALLAASLRLTTAAFGYNSAQHLLGEQQANLKLASVPLDSSGSSKLVDLEKVKSVSNISGYAQQVAKAYANPGSRIFIDVFEHGYGRKLVVYIPGTQSLDLWGKNPLNMRSNLTAFGGVAASPTELAVSDALAQVKAGESDSVLFVGHSQGALVAAQLAITDQPYQVAGLVSLGGPIAQFDLQVPVIALQNQGDPVPHLGGQINPMQENWVTASNEREFDSVVDAHKVASYVEFAKKLDTNHDPGLIRIHEQIAQMPNQSGLRYVFELSRD
ncbi:MAG: hypothetical protein RLZ65_850 [Actinomycetota bacterium]